VSIRIASNPARSSELFEKAKFEELEIAPAALRSIAAWKRGDEHHDILER